MNTRLKKERKRELNLFLRDNENHLFLYHFESYSKEKDEIVVGLLKKMIILTEI